MAARKKPTHKRIRSARAATSDAESAAPDSAAAAEPARFRVVGLGASAGGLGALESFFRAIPADEELEAAFVIVQHLAPEHASMLSELVQRFTHMPVAEITDGTRIEAERVYVIPPDRDLGVLNGTLQLFEPVVQRGHRSPVDFFFRALAHDLHERAVAVVLSGTGSDGAMGVKEIKAKGGMVIAQTPSSTQYDGMPRAAIATGVADAVLLPAEMPSRICAWIEQPSYRRAPEDGDAVHKILLLVRSQTGHDFSQYKQRSIIRRVERRMTVNQVPDLASYLRLLQQSSDEIDALFRDFSIGVTAFFRDTDAFAALETKVLPKLVAERADDQAIRVWVAGCSTGEEAYSIAILLHEQIERLKRPVKLQIFATDIDSRAIQQARTGKFPAAALRDVRPDRLSKYFTLESGDGGYRIQRFVRETILFSEQDLIRDPPFSNVDLISCRNVLIYMSPELQRLLLPTLHFALRAGGALFLGSSETVGESPLFTTLDRKAKLYQGVDGTGIFPAARKGVERKTSRPLGGRRVEPKSGGGADESRLRELTDRALLEHCAPVGALVTELGEILYLHGRTGLYLEPTPGRAQLNILNMAREGLRPELGHLLRKAAFTREAAKVTGLRVKTNGGFTPIELTIRPVEGGATDDLEARLYLVVFQPASPMGVATEPAATAGQNAAGRETEPPDAQLVQQAAEVAELKSKLQARDEYYQNMTEELQTSNEEQRSANEELQSVNEELHSTNEELETSREELQSVNEELATLNIELQAKVADLSQITNDMNNLLAGTAIATIFVDSHLNVLRFTPAASDVINLMPSDIGRPINHIVSKLVSYNSLADDLKAVLRTLTPKETEVQNHEGRWFQLRILPYRTTEDVIQGAVTTFVDITELKQVQMELRKATELNRLAVVVRDAYDAITVMDLVGKITAWNPGAERLYGWTEEEATQKTARDLIPETELHRELDRLRHLSNGPASRPYDATRITKSGERIHVQVTATALLNPAGEIYAIATTEREYRAPSGEASPVEP